MPRVRPPLLTAAVALALAVAGCADSDEPAAQGGAPVRSDGPQHIHGLGINPADDSLVIATHAGMFRAASGQQRAERVGDSSQDTMGFTVIGPDRFLGSGHPDLRTDLPPLLGLIRSVDAGAEWTPVSLLGKADFHVLRAAGRRVYAINATDGRLLVSDDSGRTWSDNQPPDGVLDVVAHPDDPDRLIASAERELYVSQDAGRTWRPRARRGAGLLAWPRADALYAVDERGAVQRSSDAGGSWDQVGEIGGQPAAFAAHGSELTWRCTATR